MEFIGQIMKISETRSGVNDQGQWQVATILVKDTTQMYGQSLLIDVWDAWVGVMQGKLGHVMKCQIDCRVREFVVEDERGNKIRRESNNIRLMSALDM